MATTEPKIKIQATKDYGGEVMLYDPEQTDEKEAIAKIKEKNTEMTIIDDSGDNNVVIPA